MNLPEWLDEDSSCIYDKQGHAVSLDVFAAAVVEDYKASLKPAAYLWQHDETGRTLIKLPEDEWPGRTWSQICPLYRLD